MIFNYLKGMIMKESQIIEIKKLYAMELHDELEVWRGLYAIRVPGGWIYRHDQEQVGGHRQATTTFVPFDTEFKNKLKGV